MGHKIKALIVDNEKDYRDVVASTLEGIDSVPDWRYEVASHDNPAYVRNNLSDVELVILDNTYGEGQSYWNDLLLDVRTQRPNATILLVSQYDDQHLKRDIEHFVDNRAKEILKTDPFVNYLPKLSIDAFSDHLDHLRLFSLNLLTRLANRAFLQSLLITTAFEAARRLHNSSLADLWEEEKYYTPEKPDTKGLDVVAEDCIKQFFVREMHLKNVVICTEEAGLHNELYHRVENPEFYVFSDPFDGSSSFAKAAKLLVNSGKASAEASLEDVLTGTTFLEDWSCGPISLNSPMVSMVLAERHRIVCGILINLFTSDVYVSIDYGNYFKNCRGLLQTDAEEVQTSIRELRQPVGWTRVEFDRLEGHEDKETAGEERPLFLCTLQALKRQLGTRGPHNAHAEVCISPIMPLRYDWKDSFDYRIKQRDFTPGPARVLFLTDCQARKTYDEQALGGNHYSCILSSGEPLTEWMGWFAFLRHSKGVSAYCLRTKDGVQSECRHRREADDPSTFLPSAINSIFREGYIDLGVLHTAYGGKMSRYTDTILVVFDNDADWASVLKKDGEELYVRIPLFGPGS